MDEIKLQIKGRERDTYTVHYSCSGFYSGGAVAPTICTIALVSYVTKDVHIFALHDYLIQGKSLIESEHQLLKDFVDFYKNLNNPVFVHWNMDGLEYGFKAILARFENYGIYDITFQKAEILNFSNYIYGSLLTVLDRNNCHSASLLNGKQEAMCFDKRNYNAVKYSTAAKAIGLSKLLNLALKGELNDEEYAV